MEKATIEREQQGKQKRPHSDETADHSKRSRAKDTRKAPPKLDTGTVLQFRNSIGSAMIESSTVKAGDKVSFHFSIHCFSHFFLIIPFKSLS